MSPLETVVDLSEPAPLFLVFLAVFAFAIICFIPSRRSLPLPPGPKGSVPFVGILFDIPKKHPFNKFTEWAEQYGPIMHCKIGRQNVIMVNDAQVSRDLLDARSKLYSDRPPSVVGDIISRGARSVLMPYGPRWRGVRKLFASMLTPAKCDKMYNRYAEAEALVSCMDIINYPGNLKRHMNRYSMSIVRSITYGRRCVRNDPLLLDQEEAAKNFVQAFRPGAFMIEYFPWMLKLPRFLQPGIKTLIEYRDVEDDYILSKYNETRQLSEKHPERQTILKDIEVLHNDPETGPELTERQCAATAMEIVGVGTDTTAASILILIHAILLYPEVLKKAHEELDRVIGQDRYPTWEDEDNLPYIRAMIKEQHRWRTIAPLSMPHYTYAEDIYNGFRIPKNSAVRVNTWAIHKDPKRYPDPDRYNPDRFLHHTQGASAYANSSNVEARDHFSYGGGKRICVGIHLAERNIFNMVVRLLHTFQIEPIRDGNGKAVIPALEDYVFGLVLLPPDFDAKFTVRSEAIRQILERDFVNVAKEGNLEHWE